MRNIHVKSAVSKMIEDRYEGDKLYLYAGDPRLKELLTKIDALLGVEK